MNKLDITKAAVNLIVGSGTSKIVSDIIKNNTTPESVVDQATVMAASLVIGSMAVDGTKKYTGAKIDEIAAWWKKNVSEKNS